MNVPILAGVQSVSPEQSNSRFPMPDDPSYNIVIARHYATAANHVQVIGGINGFVIGVTCGARDDIKK